MAGAASGDVAPPCPHCTSLNTEALDRLPGWWFCRCCARTFTPQPQEALYRRVLFETGES